MIGSLMSRMADAEKLSIPQLNQAVKNGTIPAYVGVPLIQEKMKAEQAAKAMVAQTQAQPPIARQVMEQADVMSGVEKLQSNLPEEGYAGGGIIAFAEGGISPEFGGDVTLPDDAEEDEKSLMSRLMAGITSLKQGVSDRIPPSLRGATSDGPQKGDYVAPPAERRARGNHKYENMVAQEAERIGLDPNIAVHALYKETGNLKNPESARSRAGAIGVMQLMPKTAKELGVDPFDPEDNIRGGVMYLKKMYDKYQDPTLALAAYNAGPGRLDKALKSGQGIAGLSSETRNYVVANRMAEGGSVKHFVKGDLVMGDFGEARRASLPSGSTVVDDFGNMVEKDGKKIKPPIKPSMYSRALRKVPYLGSALTAAEGIQALVDSDTGTASEDLDPIAAMQGTQGGYERPERKKDVYAELKESTRTESPPKFDFPPQRGIGPSDAELRRGVQENTPAPATTPATAPAITETYKEPPPDSGLADIKNLLKQRMEESGKQKRIDTYMSLLQAGLGMMGGTSPFAAVNIGQGASTGIAAQMAARKSQVADENAILTGQLGLSRAELYDKMRREALGQRREERSDLAGYRRDTLTETERRNRAAEANIAERNTGLNAANQIRLGQLRLNAGKEWENSSDKANIEKELSAQKKNWRQDSKLLGQFNMIKDRYINSFVNTGQADDIQSSSTL